MVKKILPFFIIVAAILIAVLPLFQVGFIPTHDGEYHIIRFFEFEKMIKSGYLFPRWAPGLNSGYGTPLFNFFYPLPNYFGALFHSSGWSLTDSFKLSLVVAYFSAGIWCFFWLKRLFGTYPAVTATIVFAFIPYWFVDIYVRGSIGEVFAISFFMLALASVEYRWTVLTSVAVAGIILSHNILTILFLPLLTGYILLQRPRHILNVLFGIGLSSYFWFPALAERGFVVGLNSVNFRDYFPDFYQLLIPSWGSGFSGSDLVGNEMSPQIGIVAIIVIILAVFFVLRERKKRIRVLVTYFISLCFLSLFFMLKVSLPIWEKISILQFLQYPWRLLSVFLPVVALAGAYVSANIRSSAFFVLLTICAIVLSYQYARPAVYLPRPDGYYLTKREFTDGTSSLGNSFSTRWSLWKNTRPQEKVEILSGSTQLTNMNMQLMHYSFQTASDTSSRARVNLVYYPGWTVLIDSKSIPIDYVKDGTIVFSIPSGKHAVEVYFAETPLRVVADIVSIASLFWIVGSAILERVYAYRYRHFTSIHGA